MPRVYGFKIEQGQLNTRVSFRAAATIGIALLLFSSQLPGYACSICSSNSPPTPQYSRGIRSISSAICSITSRSSSCANQRRNVTVRASHLAQLNRLPAMRQQFLNITCPLRRQASKNVLQISIRIMPVELGRLDQAHQRSSAFATA